MKRRKRHYKRKKNISFKAWILLGGIFAAALVCFIFLIRGAGRVKKPEPVSGGSDGILQPQPEEEEQNGEKKGYAALAPRYIFTTDETAVYIEGLKAEYTLAWVSDLHMISNITPAEDFGEQHLKTILPRYDYFKTANDVHAVDLWPEIIAYLNYHDFDGVIFGGDLIDYCSRSNIEMLIDGLGKLNKQFIYIRADHDYGSWYGGDVMEQGDAFKAHAVIDGDILSEKVMVFDEFVVVGVNDSTQDMTKKQYEVLTEYLDQSKPVIIATHVPYKSQVEKPKPGVNGKDSLEKLSMQVRNKLYYWGTENYIPHGVTVQYFNRVYSEDSNIAKVLAGHMHHNWEGRITESLSQHIFSPAFEGTIGIVHIKPKRYVKKVPPMRDFSVMRE